LFAFSQMYSLDGRSFAPPRLVNRAIHLPRFEMHQVLATLKALN
jgi:hypothetical protein